MNIEQANTIAISEILKNLYLKPAYENEHEAMYVSPIRNTRTATFRVDKITNTWFDPVIAKEGGIIELACQYLKYRKQDHTIHDALRWLEIMSGRAPGIKAVMIAKSERSAKDLDLVSVGPLEDPALIGYLAIHAITPETAAHYLEEVTVLDNKSGKRFMALGFRNDHDDYELCSPQFKGCLGLTDVTFIRGTVFEPLVIDIFKDCIGFLTAVENNNGKPLSNDVIVLNSMANLDKTAPFFNVPYYQFAHSWMDNDAEGITATRLLSEFFKTLGTIRHKPQNYIYEGHENFNAWYAHSEQCDCPGMNSSQNTGIAT